MNPKFEQYADHPRFGREPRVTGYDPISDGKPGCWHHSGPSRIPNTAVRADLSRQVAATFAVPYYFDHDRTCESCGTKFLFFAEEQKYWHEDLQFPLESFATRCFACRQEVRRLQTLRAQYDAFKEATHLTPDGAIELVHCCVELATEGVFGPKSVEYARSFLKSIPVDDPIRNTERFRSLEALSLSLLAKRIP